VSKYINQWPLQAYQSPVKETLLANNDHQIDLAVPGGRVFLRDAVLW
jgi:hypothetical protein